VKVTTDGFKNYRTGIVCVIYLSKFTFCCSALVVF